MGLYKKKKYKSLQFDLVHPELVSIDFREHGDKRRRLSANTSVHLCAIIKIGEADMRWIQQLRSKFRKYTT